MKQRPALNTDLNSQTFLSYYYLKNELIKFCKEQQLPITGNKSMLTERVAQYLNSCKIPKNNLTSNKTKIRKCLSDINENTIIEKDFVCSEIHCKFFKLKLGEQFRFTIPFQKWLKENSGKTYLQAIESYIRIQEENKNTVYPE